MIRKLIAVLTITTLLFSTSAVVFAADTYDPTKIACDNASAASSPVCSSSDADPVTGDGGIVIKIANVLAWFAGAIAVVIMIFAGFRLVKSSGDPAKITVARETIIYALVGLVVIVLARFLVGWVITKLT